MHNVTDRQTDDVMMPIANYTVYQYDRLKVKSRNNNNHLLARDSIYAIAHYVPSPIHLSVCLSHGWISQRWLKLGSCNLHHIVAP